MPEGEARPGGKILSEPGAGFLCEWGPNGVIDREPTAPQPCRPPGPGGHELPPAYTSRQPPITPPRGLPGGPGGAGPHPRRCQRPGGPGARGHAGRRAVRPGRRHAGRRNLGRHAAGRTGGPGGRCAGRINRFGQHEGYGPAQGLSSTAFGHIGQTAISLSHQCQDGGQEVSIGRPNNDACGEVRLLDLPDNGEAQGCA